MSAKSSERYQRKARGSGADGRPSRIPFDQYQFCRIELSPEEKEDCRSDYLVNLAPFDVLADLAIDGYKVSFSTGDAGKTHIASITCTNSQDANAGWTISARAANVTDALLVLGYKVLIIAGEKAWGEVHHERGGQTQDIG